jgi:hypothetical protein
MQQTRRKEVNILLAWILLIMKKEHDSVNRQKVTDALIEFHFTTTARKSSKTHTN